MRQRNVSMSTYRCLVVYYVKEKKEDSNLMKASSGQRDWESVERKGRKERNERRGNNIQPLSSIIQAVLGSQVKLQMRW